MFPDQLARVLSLIYCSVRRFNMCSDFADEIDISTSDSDEESSLLEQEHETNLAAGVDTRSRSEKKSKRTREAEDSKERFVRYRKTTGADKFIDLLSKSAVEEQSVAKAKLDLQNRQLAFQEAELTERRADREQKAFVRAQELELEKVKTEAKIKSDQDRDTLFTTTLSLLINKLN